MLDSEGTWNQPTPHMTNASGEQQPRPPGKMENRPESLVLPDKHYPAKEHSDQPKPALEVSRSVITVAVFVPVSFLAVLTIYSLWTHFIKIWVDQGDLKRGCC